MAWLRTEGAPWIARTAAEVLAEIKKSGHRRVFLADDGSVMVRGRGTPEHLKIALRHHEKFAQMLLADREAVEELIPAPEPSGPAVAVAA